mmetsp:Transcript_12089/g.33979  ORF Transcript_12089/g.33979 Transcript_12089/m.33979 type:complete len:371 (+) Transcript_12089:231-1343(+)
MEEFGVSPFRTPEALARTRAVRLQAILRSARGPQILGIDLKVLLFVGAHTLALVVLYTGNTYLTKQVTAAATWHAAPSVIYVSSLGLLVGATTGLYACLYASDPGWVTRDAVDSDSHGHSAYCHYCGFRPPFRSRHCLQTGQCVQKFDHFCYLLSTAIGDCNHARFFSFLACELALAVWGASIVSDWAAACLLQRGDSPVAAVCWRSWAPVALLPTGLALLTLALFFGYLVALHTYLMLTGQTTYEVVKGSKVPYLSAYYRPLGFHAQRHIHLPEEFPCLLIRHITSTFPPSSCCATRSPPPPAPFSLGWRRNLAVFWLRPKPHSYRLQLPAPADASGGLHDSSSTCCINGSALVPPSAVIDVQYSQGEV